MKSIADSKFDELYKIAKANKDVSLLIDLASCRETKKNARKLANCRKIKESTEIVKFTVPRYTVDGDFNLVTVEGFYKGTNWYHCKVKGKHRLMLMFSVEMVETLDEIFDRYAVWVEEQNTWSWAFTKTQFKVIESTYQSLLEFLNN